MRTATIMRGVSGSGKSTYVNRLDAVVCSADDYFMRDGKYEFDVKQLTDAHTWCFRRWLDTLVEGKQDVVCDNTNVTLVALAPYIQSARAYGYDPRNILVQCDPRIAAVRNSHGVPPAVVVTQYQRLVGERVPGHWPKQEVFIPPRATP